MIPPRPDKSYLVDNHLWNAAAGEIKLQAARNEFVAFQVLLQGTPAEVRPTLKFEDAGATADRGLLGALSKCRDTKGPLPDPIVPLDAKAARGEIELRATY